MSVRPFLFDSENEVNIREEHVNDLRIKMTTFAIQKDFLTNFLGKSFFIRTLTPQMHRIHRLQQQFDRLRESVFLRDYRDILRHPNVRDGKEQ